MSKLVIAMVVVGLASSLASAGIISWNCDDDGDGAIVMDTPTWSDLGNAEYRLEMQGTQDWFPAHIEGDFTVDGDPTVWLVESIDNSTNFAWTDYHITIGMSQPFSIVGVVAPMDWTWNITAPVAGTIPNGGGAGYVGVVDYFAGTPIGIGSSGNFGLVMSFVGSVSFATEQIPTPEPGTLGLLTLGLLALRRRR